MTLTEQLVGVSRESFFHDGESCGSPRRHCDHEGCRESLWVRYWRLDETRRRITGLKMGVVAYRPSLWAIVKLEWLLWRAPWQPYVEAGPMEPTVVIR